MIEELTHVVQTALVVVPWVLFVVDAKVTRYFIILDVVV